MTAAGVFLALRCVVIPGLPARAAKKSSGRSLASGRRLTTALLWLPIALLLLALWGVLVLQLSLPGVGALWLELMANAAIAWEGVTRLQAE